MMNSDYKKVILLLTLILMARPLLSKAGEYMIFITGGSSGRTGLNVEVADTQAERENGLMFRYSLPEDKGMLFVFENEKNLSFWMKNTYIPLDIAYISRSGIINEIYRMEPLDYSVIYPSKKPAKYALEVNAGWFQKKGITPGMKLDFNGCLRK